MDYSKGKIYLLIDTSCGDLYVGSTIQRLKDRHRTHNFYKDYNKKKSNCKISMIEEYPCENEIELKKREQFWIERIDCINKQNAYRDPEYHNKQVNLRCRNRYHYRNSWGGDERWNNNLLLIDPDLFIIHPS
jgi:hypothetical protein